MLAAIFDIFCWVLGFTGVVVSLYEFYILFKPPKKKTRKRYRWNIYWSVWDEWDDKDQCYYSKYPPPFIVSIRKASQ
jgi:hypothetical protein